MLLLYAAAVWWSDSPSALAGTLFLLALAPPMFYQDVEGSALVEVSALSPERFLRHKITRSAGLLGAFAAPVVALFWVRHPPLWYVPLVILALSSVLLAGSILIKYAGYREGHRASIAIPLGIFGAGGLPRAPPGRRAALHPPLETERPQFGAVPACFRLTTSSSATAPRPC